jgi:hypothetical protein
LAHGTRHRKPRGQQAAEIRQEASGAIFTRCLKRRAASATVHHGTKLQNFSSAGAQQFRELNATTASPSHNISTRTTRRFTTSSSPSLCLSPRHPFLLIDCPHLLERELFIYQLPFVNSSGFQTISTFRGMGLKGAGASSTSHDFCVPRLGGTEF